MRIETPAYAYSVSNLHSSKTQRDYTTIGLAFDGEAKSHFIRDEDLNNILSNPKIQRLQERNEPQNVVAVFDVRCTSKGWFGSLVGIK